MPSSQSDSGKTTSPSQQVGNVDLIQLQVARDSALQAARAAIRDTTRLTRLLAILGEPGPLSDLLDRALSTLSELFTADILVLLDPRGSGTSVPLASVGLPEGAIHLPFADEPSSLLGRLMQEAVPIEQTEASRDLQVDFQLLDLGAETIIGLPVAGSHAMRGALILARCRPEPFAASEIDLLATMAYRIGLALEEAQLSTQFKKITQNSRIIGSVLDLQVIANEAVRMLPAIVDADAASLVLSRPDGQYECIAQFGLPVTYVPVLSRLGGHLLTTIEFNKPFCTDALPMLLNAASCQVLQDSHVQVILSFLLGQKETLRGVFFAFRMESHKFLPTHEQMGALYANHVSAALENAILYQAVQDELSERLKVEQALRASDERFRALIRSVSDIIAILSPAGIIHYISPAAELVWTDLPSALLGQNIFNLIHQEDKSVFRKLLLKIEGQQNDAVKSTVRLKKYDIDWRFFEVTLVNLVDEPSVSGIVATFHDVTERNLYEHQLSQLAFSDPLTGLANRAHFMERLQISLVRANMLGQPVGVIFFDLDNFKIINDTFGHASGDLVLCTVAERVRSCLRKDDLAARLGGDEFTILIEGLDHVEQILPMVNRLMVLLLSPIHIETREVTVGVSMGIALSTGYEDDSTSLLHKADRAMYHAKKTGKGRYAIFHPEIK
jgi:diguanylate cyclase (GGDEF)-like protein/PAS domain S-box-containing protein